MPNVYNWSTTPANNATADGNLWPEGQLPSTVNDSSRSNMAAIARWRKDSSGEIATTGSVSNYFLPANNEISVLTDGMSFSFRANHTNTGEATLNVNFLGAKPLRKDGGSVLIANDILVGGIYQATYVATADEFRLYSVPSLHSGLDAKVSVAGDTMTGGLSIAAEPAFLTLAGTTTAADSTRLQYSSGGSLRWQLCGSDDLLLHRYGDGQEYLGTPLMLDRYTGAATFTGAVTVNAISGASTFTLGGDPSSTNSLLHLQPGTGESAYITFSETGIADRWAIGMDHTDGVFRWRQINALGDSKMQLNQSGDLTVAGILTAGSSIMSGGLQCNGNLDVGGVLFVEDAIRFTGPANNKAMYYKDDQTWYHYWNITNGDWAVAGPSGNQLHLKGDTGALTIRSATALKPGGGSWTDPSDARIKTVVGDYMHGLAEILQLEPRRYTYKGNDVLTASPNVDARAPRAGAPNPMSSHYQAAVDGAEFIGLVAQECETVMPELVQQVIAEIDGVEVDDLRTLDTSALTYAILNACKELAQRVDTLIARIEALEAAAQPQR